MANMASQALTQPLRQVALLRGLAPLQITEIARRADRIVYRPGDRIITAGASADAAVIIVAGAAERVAGPGLAGGSPELIPTGAVLAEMAMFVETVHTSTVVAKTAVRALRIDREYMLELLAGEPDLAEHFIAIVSGRLKAVAAEMRAVEAGLSASFGDSAPVVTLSPAASSVPSALN